MPYLMQSFSTDDHRKLRTVVINGEPWFVLTDVCRVLDMQSKKGCFGHHAEKLDDDQKLVIARSDISRTSPPFEGEGNEAVPGNQATVISESGLYSLVLRSDKPEAKRLRKWVTSVVLPSIRRTGSYSPASNAAPELWKPFHDRLNLALAPVPEGFFSISREMADLTAQGAIVDHTTIPDTSLGQAWAKEWAARGHDVEFGALTTYQHNYPAYFPQATSNPHFHTTRSRPDHVLGVRSEVADDPAGGPYMPASPNTLARSRRKCLGTCLR